MSEKRTPRAEKRSGVGDRVRGRIQRMRRSVSYTFSAEHLRELFSARSLARRSLEEATNSIALVICMVLSTLLIRSLISFMEPAMPCSLLT